MSKDKIIPNDVNQAVLSKVDDSKTVCLDRFCPYQSKSGDETIFCGSWCPHFKLSVGQLMGLVAELSCGQGTVVKIENKD